MASVPTARRSAQDWLFAFILASGIAGVVLLALIALLIYWGSGQSITPTYVERNLLAGATIEEAEFSLGLHPGLLRQSSAEWREGTIATIGESGVGAMFVPQHEYALVFGADGRLLRAWVDVVYQCDENGYELKLRQP
ncbi:MAG: hypothetical protein AB7O26_15445 [Planctomycetaceae bacterium]